MHRQLCGTTFIYPGKTLEEGLLLAREFGFHTVDVGCGGRNGHVSPVDAANDPQRTADRVRRAVEDAGLAIHECFTLNFGPPLNDPDARRRVESIRQFQGLCQFASLVGFEGIMLIPGPIHPALGQQASLDLAVEAISNLLPIAQEHCVRLDIETDCDSCAFTPRSALELCERIEGIRLALDYSHFIYHNFTHDEIEPLDRYAGHVHVRQASPRRIVERVADGTIDFPRLVRHLQQLAYQGKYCVEYLACWEADECQTDVAHETPIMIQTLNQLLTSYERP